MKNKFVLTEEESKRILSLHKERIKEERSHIIEQTEEYTDEQKAKYGEKSLSFIENNVLTVPATFTAENADTYTLASELKIFKDSKFKPTGTKGVFSYTGKYQYVDDLSGDNEMGNFNGTVLYYCKKAKFKVKGQPYSYFIENYPVMYRAFIALCGVSSGSKVTTTPPKDLLTTAKKCGYSSVDEYKKANWKCPKGGGKKQLTDQEKINKAEKCGHSSWNEYKNSGWKCKTDGGGTNTGGGGTNTGGGGGGNQTYPFDYETVLNTIKQKFPDEIINPFEQGDEEEIQLDIVTDKIYSEL